MQKLRHELHSNRLDILRVPVITSDTTDSFTIDLDISTSQLPANLYPIQLSTLLRLNFPNELNRNVSIPILDKAKSTPYTNDEFIFK